MIEKFPPLQLFSRPRYSAGQPVTADDFVTEQQYHLEKLRLHNRMLHGSGVVSGFAVSQQKNLLIVEAGFALDCMGREIILPHHLEVNLLEGDIEPYLAVQYHEVPVDPEGGGHSGRLQEQYVVLWTDEQSVECFRRRKAGRIACGQAHPLPVARVIRRGAAWKLDRKFKPPRVR